MANNKIVFAGQTLIDLTADDITSADVISAKKFHLPSGNTATGTMPNRGKVAGKIKTGALTYTVPQGYHDGTGTVEVEEPDLIADNIRKGITLLGVEGTLQGGEEPAYAYIGVTYPAGSACNCTNGVIVLNAEDTSGITVFRIPVAGTWTVNCTDGQSTDSKSFDITQFNQFETYEVSYAYIFTYDGIKTGHGQNTTISYSNGVWTITNSGSIRWAYIGDNLKTTILSNLPTATTVYIYAVEKTGALPLIVKNGTTSSASTVATLPVTVDVANLPASCYIGTNGSNNQSCTFKEIRIEKVG